MGCLCYKVCVYVTMQHVLMQQIRVYVAIVRAYTTNFVE
jgi:hypothetical protein